MNLEDFDFHQHLGDGVYAQFDGYGIVLRANSHRDEECTDKIYLEPNVIENLNIFVDYIKQTISREYKNA